MADNTKIEWADATLNYVNGCTRVSLGCGGPGIAGGCYAERQARFSSAKCYEGHHFVPFIAVRHQEKITLGTKGALA